MIQELPKGTLVPTPQNHEVATFCTKITKKMAKLNLDPNHLPTGDAAQEAYRQICAFDLWPEAFLCMMESG